MFKFRLGEQIDGTGRAAVVLTRGPGWASPDQVQSTEYPRLFVDSLADPTRGPAGEIMVQDGEDRAFALAMTIRPWFRYPRLRGERMGSFGSRPGLLVISSQQWAEPRLIRASDYHTILERKQAGDVVAVRTEYALEVVHDG